MEIDREAFLFESESKLEQWNAVIAGLERTYGTRRDIALAQRIEALVQRRNTFNNKVEKLRQCPAHAWRRVSQEVALAAREVDEAWSCMAQLLRAATVDSRQPSRRLSANVS